MNQLSSFCLEVWFVLRRFSASDGWRVVIWVTVDFLSAWTSLVILLWPPSLTMHFHPLDIFFPSFCVCMNISGDGLAPKTIPWSESLRYFFPHSDDDNMIVWLHNCMNYQVYMCFQSGWWMYMNISLFLFKAVWLIWIILWHNSN